MENVTHLDIGGAMAVRLPSRSGKHRDENGKPLGFGIFEKKLAGEGQ
jgi:hypothetical protein